MCRKISKRDPAEQDEAWKISKRAEQDEAWKISKRVAAEQDEAW